MNSASRFFSMIAAFLSLFLLFSAIRVLSFAPSFSLIASLEIFVAIIVLVYLFFARSSPGFKYSFLCGGILALFMQFFSGGGPQHLASARVLSSADAYTNNPCDSDLLSAKGFVSPVRLGDNAVIFMAVIADDGGMFPVDDYEVLRAIPPRFIHRKIADLFLPVRGVYKVLNVKTVACTASKNGTPSGP
jgi:hypothetical protein